MINCLKLQIDSDPGGMPNNLIPLVTFGDGNYLPHVLLSDQGCSDKVRVHITFVLVPHKENFVTHQSLTRGCPCGTSNRHHSYTLYSGSMFAATYQINDRVVHDEYWSDVLANSKDGNYKHPISLIYPQHTNRSLQADLNIIILPLSPVHDNKTTVCIMWNPLN